MNSPESAALRVVVRNSKEEVERAKKNTFARLYAEALAIEAEDAKSAGQLGFVAKWVVHAALPYKNPGDHLPAWGRRSGDVSLMIQPGFYKKPVSYRDKKGVRREEEKVVSIGFPYGSYPRLLLAWIATEVVRTRQRELVLGSSVGDFMLQLGKQSVTGGTRGTLTLLKTQMMRLFASQIAVCSDPQAMVWNNDGFRLLDDSRIETFWAPGDPNQLSLFRSTLRLSERFYDTLITSPVPVDLRALKVLARSPMAIDIYCWITYRAATIQRNTKVPWEALMQQFGSESSEYKFRENFLKQLQSVQLVYKGAKVETDKTGLMLLASSRPSIAKRG